MRGQVIRAVAVVFLGMLGMGLFQLSTTLWKDLRFLHKVRLNIEQQQRQNIPAQPEGPKP
jgi:hypothetical protein